MLPKVIPELDTMGVHTSFTTFSIASPKLSATPENIHIKLYIAISNYLEMGYPE